MDSKKPSEIFGAFREKRKRRLPVFALGVLLTTALLMLAAVWSWRGQVQVVTSRGIRSLKYGMTIRDVDALSPAPNPEGQLCWRYGSLYWKRIFALYSVCFQGGRMRSVERKYYGVWKVAKDGTFSPP